MAENHEEFTGKSAQDIISEPKKRQIAFRLRISEINNAVVSENKAFLEIGDKKVIRINLLSNVIDKFINEGEKKFASLTLDDGSSQIRVKTFGEDVSKFDNIEIGDTILVIGFVRYFNNEIYLLPEIIKKINEKWLLVRKYELAKEKQYDKIPKKDNREIESIAFRKSPNREEIKTEKILEESTDFVQETDIKENILKVLKEKEEGVDVETLILTIRADVKKINDSITELLDEALIYEPKPGFIRLL